MRIMVRAFVDYAFPGIVRCLPSALAVRPMLLADSPTILVRSPQKHGPAPHLAVLAVGGRVGWFVEESEGELELPAVLVLVPRPRFGLEWEEMRRRPRTEHRSRVVHVAQAQRDLRDTRECADGAGTDQGRRQGGGPNNTKSQGGTLMIFGFVLGTNPETESWLRPWYRYALI